VSLFPTHSLVPSVFENQAECHLTKIKDVLVLALRSSNNKVNKFW